MSDADELRQRFDEFRVESLARTNPPGPAAVQHTVRRRQATWTGVFAVAAIIALLAVWLPLSAAGPAPIDPSPSPSPSATATITPSPGSSAATGPPATVAGPGPTTAPACDPQSGTFVGLNVVSPTPDSYELTPSMLSVCPSLRIWLTQATYVGSGAASGTVARTASTPVVLSAARQSVAFTATLPAPTCASVVIVTLVGYSGSPNAPASMANPVPGLVSTGSTEDLRYYLLQRFGAILRNASWQAPAC